MVLREDSNDYWSGLTLSRLNPGVTVRCPGDDYVDKQVVMINVNYAKTTQVMEAVARHETGHTLGLDHSCMMDGGSENFVGCSQLSANHPYRQAVMNPLLQLNTPTNGLFVSQTGATNQSAVQTNDVERAKCLYKN
jgi:hypothetical protein